MGTRRTLVLLLFPVSWRKIVNTVQANLELPVYVGFDSSFEDSDQVLAHCVLMGLAARNKAHFHACTLSRNDLTVAAFCDLVANFYFPSRNLERDELSAITTVGLPATFIKGDSPPLSGVVQQRTPAGEWVYPRAVMNVSDTADPVTLLRNQLYAQKHRLVLSGSPVNLLEVLKLTGAEALLQKQLEFLVISGGRFLSSKPDPRIRDHAAAFRTLLATWPTPIVFVGAEIGEELRLSGQALERDLAWAEKHPVRDAYRGMGRSPYDVEPQTSAAALYAASRDSKDFVLSNPGVVTIEDDGATRFAPSAQGRHRYLLPDPGQKAHVQEELLSNVGFNPRARVAAKPVAQVAAKAGEQGKARPALLAALAVLMGIGLFWSPNFVEGQDADQFNQLVKPTLDRCATCHNSTLRTGGLDVTQLNTLDGLLKSRAVWERMVRRVRSRDMPPAGTVRIPPAELTGMTGFVENYWQRTDSSRPADPGRLVAHRLNRQEYANSVRDLLGIQFDPEHDLPADDTGEGFDIIGDLLTMSPTLVDRYFNVAEMLSRWAVSDQLPPEALYVHFGDADPNFYYVAGTEAELRHRIDYSGDYTVLVTLMGARPGDAAPVKLGFWVDGKLAHTEMVETKGYDPQNTYPEADQEFRVFLPAGDHVFRAGFIDDSYVKGMDPAYLFYETNKFVRALKFAGPLRSAEEAASRRAILNCDIASEGCVRRTLTTLARRAFRRPVTPAEVDALMRFPQMARANGRPASEGIQLAIQAVLLAPSFLYRVERSPDQGTTTERVSDIELASRLSFFLWSSIPDDTLLDLAEAGRLSDPAVLRQQVDRMLVDPKAAAFAGNFAGQWLETRSLNSASPDPKKFPGWSPALRDAMQQETARFFEYILKENRPISEFLDAKYTFLNEALAQHYGIAGVTGTEFRRVDLSDVPNGSQRGGILSQAGVLTVSSYANRTSPVLRGKYVLQSILGAPPPPPPPNVPRLDEATVGVQRSMREQMEEHRKNPECAACHSRMDPLGFGLENYDAIGRWRTEDGKFPVDSRGKLPDGTTFNTPDEMRKALVSQLPQFSRNLVEKVLMYALHRSLEPADRPTIDGLQQQLAANQYRLRTLIYAVVDSLPFQFKRREDAGVNP